MSAPPLPTMLFRQIDMLRTDRSPAHAKLEPGNATQCKPGFERGDVRDDCRCRIARPETMDDRIAFEDLLTDLAHGVPAVIDVDLLEPTTQRYLCSLERL
jgi:hypothetical protein